MPDEVSFGSAIAACEKQGRWVGALELLSTMEEACLPVTALTMSLVISAASKGGQWERAMALLRTGCAERGVVPEATCYNSAMHGLAKARTRARACARTRVCLREDV